jgi:hypothetical protein
MRLVHKINPSFIILYFIINGCSPANQITSSWTNKNHKQEKAYDKIFIAALVTNPHVRTHIEEEMRNNISKNGINVESSLDYFPPKFTKNTPPDVQSMIDKIKQLDCGLIFTISMIEKQSETRYIPGSAGLYGPYPGYNYRFRGFYSYWYPFMYDPGYYVTDKTYFMEGNIFETSTETLLWSVQTETINPLSVEKFSKELVALMWDRALIDVKEIKLKKPEIHY